MPRNTVWQHLVSELYRSIVESEANQSTQMKRNECVSNYAQSVCTSVRTELFVPNAFVHKIFKGGESVWNNRTLCACVAKILQCAIQLRTASLHSGVPEALNYFPQRGLDVQSCANLSKYWNSFVHKTKPFSSQTAIQDKQKTWSKGLLLFINFTVQSPF